MRAHGHKVTLTVHYSPGHEVLSTLLSQVSALPLERLRNICERTLTAARQQHAPPAATRQDLSFTLLVTTLADLDGVAGVDINEDDDE